MFLDREILDQLILAKEKLQGVVVIRDAHTEV